MSLETRVETLEHEFKILKNEIEGTLLEIQNQILVHYYPALRAEESAPPKDLLPVVEASHPEKRAKVQDKENLDSRSGNTTLFIAPKTKETSLHDIRGKSNKTVLLPKTEFMIPPVDMANQTVLTYLARWVNESVETIGKARTRSLIESSAKADYCTPEIVTTLLQLIDLSDEEEPPAQVETKELMNILLKLHKALDQVAKVAEISSPVNESEEEEERGQGNHNDLYDHR